MEHDSNLQSDKQVHISSEVNTTSIGHELETDDEILAIGKFGLIGNIMSDITFKVGNPLKIKSGTGVSISSDGKTFDEKADGGTKNLILGYLFHKRWGQTQMLNLIKYP